MSTPEEDFSGKKLDVSYFKIFGSFFYFHVTKDARKKLEPTTEDGIFVGYTNTLHNYRVYFSINMMIDFKGDVKCDEEKAMQFSLERELDLDADEEILVPNDEPQDVEDHGVEKTTM